MISKARLKKLAKNYRKTKKYPMMATIAEYEYLDTQWKTIEDMLKRSNELNLETCVSLTVGSWQADHGFTLTSRQVFGKKWK